MPNPIEERILIDGRVCPWWFAYTFDNPLRRLLHNPRKILGPYVKEGDTAVDIGCGMGPFTVELARLVGYKLSPLLWKNVRRPVDWTVMTSVQEVPASFVRCIREASMPNSRQSARIVSPPSSCPTRPTPARGKGAPSLARSINTL